MKRNCFVIVTAFLCLTVGQGKVVFASIHDNPSEHRKDEEVKSLEGGGYLYQTYFNSCPRAHVGKLVLEIVNDIKGGQSLLSVKKRIIEEKLDKRFFLSSYEVKVDPIKNMIGLKFQCPRPIFRVHNVTNLQDTFESVLVENGDLFDTTYEYMYYLDKIKDKDLPYLTLSPPLSQNVETAQAMAKLQKKFLKFFQTNLSEIIISDKGEMTLVFSHQYGSSTAFMGDSGWDEKIQRLQKILGHFVNLKKVPSHINLINPKKVVVKFAYNF